MRASLILIAASLASLAFGCDDPDTLSRVTSLAENGGVEASVSCESLVADGSGRGFSYSGKRLADGSTLATGFFFDRGGASSAIMAAGQGTTLCGRSEACSAVALARAWRTAQLNGSGTNGSFMHADFEVSDGTLTITYVSVNPPSAPSPWVERTVDLATECTGFNLEAFGVE